MSEIEIGECVRTKTGIIDKVDRIVGMIENTVHLENSIWIDINDIVKHSKNIIDLIEEGDFVNGNYVVQVSKEFNCVFIETKYYDELREEEKHNFIKEQNIETILTNEMYENNCYKVEG